MDSINLEEIKEQLKKNEEQQKKMRTLEIIGSMILQWE